MSGFTFFVKPLGWFRYLVETLTAKKSSPEAPTGRHLSDPRIRAEAARQLRDLHICTGNTIACAAMKVRSDGSKALENARVRTSTFRACRRHRLLTITSTRLTDRADRL